MHRLYATLIALLALLVSLVCWVFGPRSLVDLTTRWSGPGMLRQEQ